MAEFKYQFDDPQAAFAEAEKRIKEARAEKALKLVLYWLGLAELPESLFELTQLKTLYLHQNRLTELPDEICQLTELRELHLDGNQLRKLPESMRKLRLLERLFLHDNNDLGLPREIFRRKPADIIDYCLRLHPGKRPLNEAKLILLGRGEVGKTCLVNRLVHDRFTQPEMTRGIEISQWLARIDNDTVRLHVWDFGGQEIQHATHQFFLTERSLYLVVLNGRAGAEEEDAEL